MKDYFRDVDLVCISQRLGIRFANEMVDVGNVLHPLFWDAVSVRGRFVCFRTGLTNFQSVWSCSG